MYIIQESIYISVESSLLVHTYTLTYIQTKPLTSPITAGQFNDPVSTTYDSHLKICIVKLETEKYFIL